MTSPTALVSNSAKIAESVMIWDFSHVRDGAVIADNVIVGLGEYTGTDVRTRPNSKI